MQTALEITAPEITALDHTLLALADPTRRAILQRLSELPRNAEARVTDLAAPFAISLNAVSKHIRLLERAELVTRRRQGREHLLTFNPAPLTRAEQWITERKAMWERRLDALGDFLTATKPDDEGQQP
jgi:DNA-binding transcriptional ArsR family regulator